MAAGSNNLTTYYAKRIIGDNAAASPDKALLQTGTSITSDEWILNQTARYNESPSKKYGILYNYDSNGHDVIEFWGNKPDTNNNNNPIPSVSITLDSGNTEIMGTLDVVESTLLQSTLTVNGTSLFKNTVTIQMISPTLILDSTTNDAVGWTIKNNQGIFTIINSSNDSGTQILGNSVKGWQIDERLYINTTIPDSPNYTLYVSGKTYVSGVSYLDGNVGIGYNPETNNAPKLYINGTTYGNSTITSHTDFKCDTTGHGLYLVDSASKTYAGIYDNGSNIWIGATSSGGQHHKGNLYISAGHNGTEGNKSIYISIPANGNATTTHTSYPLVYKDKTGSATKGIYTDANGKTAEMTYSLVADVNASGNANRIAYYSGKNAISSGSIVTDGGYLGSVSYLSINNAHQTNYRLYVNGTTWHTDHIYLAAAKHIYMSYNSTNYNILHNHNNGNVSLNAASAGLYMAYQNTTFVNWMDGRMELRDGCLSLFPNNGSYREGIRIHAHSSWSDITLCGNDNTGNSGISANSWFIGNNNGNFYISRNGSPGSTAYIGCVSNVWKIYGNQANSKSKQQSILHIYGPTYGNTAADMISGTAGLFSWGDGGPQITFDTSGTPGDGQAGALIFTDHDTAATGASWHFVSNQSDWNVTSKRFHAKTSISIGSNLPNTSYNFVINGTANHTTGYWYINGGAGGIINGAATNGGLNTFRMGDDVWLGDCNAGGIMGMKSTGTNCGFYMYNSSGTQIGQLYFNGTNLYCNKTIEHPDASVSYIAGAKGSGAALYAKKTYNADHWYPAVALETKGGGAWQIGNYNDETLEFQYATKANRDNNNNSTSEIYMQNGDTGRVMTSGNYTNWTVTKTGSGASGTWGISISGNAATASKVGAGAATWMYFNNSNEVNFGGTYSTNGKIYFGYRATDSRPKPTEYYFGSGSGTAAIYASTIHGAHTDINGTKRELQIRYGTKQGVAWGTQTSITFSSAFPNACLAVIPYSSHLGFAAGQSINVGNISKTGFTIYQYNTGGSSVACTLSYVAIGY